MRRHPEFKHCQVALKSFRINLSRSQSGCQIFPPVQTLASSCDLNSLEQQIETARGALRPSWGGVERARRQRKSKNKHGRESALLFCKFAKLSFSYGIQVVHQVCPSELAAQHFKACAELPTRSFQHGGKRLLAILADDVSIARIKVRKNIGQQLPFQLDNILGSINEPEFNIEGKVFRQMAARGMRLGTVYVTRLVNPFQPSDAVLLIELWALGKIGHAIEVLNFEEIAAAFGTAGNDLRGYDFGETPAVQCVSKTAQQRCLNAENVAHRFCAQSQRPELQKSFQPNRFHVVGRLKRERVPGSV